MYKPADMSLWKGRIDNTAQKTTAGNSARLHQKIQPWDNISDLKDSVTLIGFACDEGVRRNQGRPGAKQGPVQIRTALANTVFPTNISVHDAGDISCNDENLEAAQQSLARQVCKILSANGQPIILGGGHEMAWGSFLGTAHYLSANAPKRHLGIINFDAHFDLRNPNPHANSGTAFRQISAWCKEHKKNFNYYVFGINPSANSHALFKFAKQKKVHWHLDTNCTLAHLTEIEKSLSQFLSQIDELYLTVCLDVFPASTAPGVSAPAALGVDPLFVINALKLIKTVCKKYQVVWRTTDIAELNPNYDSEQRTANLAARLVYEIAKNQKTVTLCKNY